MLRGKFRRFESGQFLVHSFVTGCVELGLDSEMAKGVFEL